MLNPFILIIITGVSGFFLLKYFSKNENTVSNEKQILKENDLNNKIIILEDTITKLNETISILEEEKSNNNSSEIFINKFISTHYDTIEN